MTEENLQTALEAIEKIPRKPMGHRDNLLRALSFSYILKGYSFKESVIMAEADIRELEK